MTVPGSNLLARALTLISSQSVTYFKDAGRMTTAALKYVTAFEPGVVIPQGSVQAVPRGRYQNLGLDWSKNYVTWFVSAVVIGVERDKSGDQIEWNGKRYGVESVTAWNAQDGWNECLCIELGPANVG